MKGSGKAAPGAVSETASLRTKCSSYEVSCCMCGTLKLVCLFVLFFKMSVLPLNIIFLDGKWHYKKMSVVSESACIFPL